MTPELAFDLQLAICIALVWICAVLWNRWYIKRLWVKTFVEELRREAALRRLYK